MKAVYYVVLVYCFVFYYQLYEMYAMNALKTLPRDSFLIPRGLSFANAFTALYIRAGGLDALWMLNKELHIKSVADAIGVFCVYSHEDYCQKVRDRDIKIDFSKFPFINVREFNHLYGVEAAEAALRYYAQETNKQIDPDNKAFKPKNDTLVRVLTIGDLCNGNLDMLSTDVKKWYLNQRKNYHLKNTI